MLSKIVTLGDNADAYSPVKYSGRPLTPNEIGAGFGRLTGLTIAHKQANGHFISSRDRRRLTAASGLGAAWADHNLTMRIMSETAENLGKGGVIGSISNAVSSAVNTVAKPIQQAVQIVTKPLENIVSKIPVVGPNIASTISAVTGGSNAQGIIDLVKSDAKMAAPVLSKIPVVGPAVSAAMNLVGQAGQQGKDSAGMLTTNPIGAVANFAGGIIGDVVGFAGNVVNGVISAPGQIFNDIAALGGPAYSGIKGFLSSGGGVLQQFGSSVWASVEQADPSLSGELTSLFHSAGADFASFGPAFDNWSRTLKNSPAGQYTGKVGDQIYTIVKDKVGHFTAQKTPVANASNSAVTQIPNGGLVPSDPSVYSAARPQVGTPNYPGYTMAGLFQGQGVPTNASGVSLPGGPVNGVTSAASDPTSMALLRQQMTKQASAFQEAGASPMLLLVGAGLLAAVYFGGVGRGPLTRRRR